MLSALITGAPAAGVPREAPPPGPAARAPAAAAARPARLPPPAAPRPARTASWPNSPAPRLPPFPSHGPARNPSAGVRRAFPYVPPDEVEPLVTAHADALFRLVHARSFGVATQALLLLFQLMSSRSTVSDRFYRWAV